MAGEQQTMCLQHQAYVPEEIARHGGFYLRKTEYCGQTLASNEHGFKGKRHLIRGTHLRLSHPLLMPEGVCARIVVLAVNLAVANSTESCFHCRVM